MPKELSIREQKELTRRWTNFLIDLTPEERKSSVLAGEPNLCDQGKKMFGEYCDNPKENIQFLTHFGAKPGCEQCHDAFLKHLWLVTD